MVRSLRAYRQALGNEHLTGIVDVDVEHNWRIQSIVCELILIRADKMKPSRPWVHAVILGTDTYALLPRMDHSASGS